MELHVKLHIYVTHKTQKQTSIWSKFVKTPAFWVLVNQDLFLSPTPPLFLLP